MRVTKDTTIHEIIKTYPYMLDWFASYAPEFKKLRNPVLKNTIARAATLEAAAELADKPLDEFLDDVRTEIAEREIVSEEMAGSGTPPGAPTDTEKQEALKGIIRKLHKGVPPSEVKAEFDTLVKDIDSAEIARMEQALIAEGMPVEEVQRLCDVHVTVFKESLERSEPEAEEASLPDTHPISAYLAENRALESVVASVRKALDAASSADDDARAAALVRLSSTLEDLSRVDVHYLRAENQLFPALEAHGVEGPTKVMWGIHDDIRARLKEATALVVSGDMDALSQKLPETLQMIEDMVYKEDKILFPTALEVMSDKEWVDISAGDAEIGYAWIEAPGRYEGGAGESVSTPASETLAGGLSGLLPLTTGALSVEQLDLLFQNIPFDLTYVDEEDRVRFYSEGNRVFPRSPGVIGREVRNCHPPSSVDKVEQILSEFKAGTKDVAEFWIELGERFIHIRYFALRDEDGTYKGCLEVVEDATHVRSLEGERRIVDW